MDKTLLQKLDAELPPFRCACWARAKPYGKLAGPKIISQRSGIAYRTVQRISASITWAGLDISVVSAFIEACGLRVQRKVSIIWRNEINAYCRWCAKQKKGSPAIRPFAHLNDYQFSLFNERSRKWLEAQGKSR